MTQDLQKEAIDVISQQTIECGDSALGMSVSFQYLRKIQDF